jgi:hypothetical protein
LCHYPSLTTLYSQVALGNLFDSVIFVSSFPQFTFRIVLLLVLFRLSTHRALKGSGCVDVVVEEDLVAFAR